jgi:hypothetical protein
MPENLTKEQASEGSGEQVQQYRQVQEARQSLNKGSIKIQAPSASSKDDEDKGAAAARSIKGVSFSLVNQTIDSYNLVRTTAATAVESKASAGSNGSRSADKMAGAPKWNPPGPVTGAAATAAAATAAAASSRRNSASTASFRPDLHLQMSSMAENVLDGARRRSLSYSLKDADSPKAGSVVSPDLIMDDTLSGADYFSLFPNERLEEASEGSTLALNQELGADGLGADDNLQHVLTSKAVMVIRRVMDKLTGLDFHMSMDKKQKTRSTSAASAAGASEGGGGKGGGRLGGGDVDGNGRLVALDVPEQVDRLIIEATSNENLSLSFFGWCK